MDLSLSEAARLLGKSERQVRYLIQQGKLPARKRGGRWRVRSDHLPVSTGQRRAEEHKRKRAVRMALEVLEPAAGEDKKRFSIRELRAFRAGAPLYRELVNGLGPDHPAAVALREALMLLACGCHEFHGPEKATYYGRAREQVSRCAMALLLDGGEEKEPLSARLEETVLPSIGGLIRQAERQRRPR